MAAYSIGTARITAGSSTVFGNGTQWDVFLDAGDLFKVSGDSVFYEISSVVSASELTLTTRYANSNFHSAVASNVASVTTATKMYSGTLGRTPVIQNSIRFVASTAEAFTDNGAGVLAGNASPAGSGTIDYDSGAWAITFGTPLTATRNLAASFNQGTLNQGLSYQAVVDYTPNYGIPEMSTNDTNFAHIYTKAMRIVDKQIALASLHTTASVITASHFLGVKSATMNNMSIINASITNASINNLLVQKVKGTNASFVAASIQKAKILNASMANASINNLLVKNIKGTNASFVAASIQKAKILNASVNSATIARLTVRGGLLEVGKDAIQAGTLRVFPEEETGAVIEMHVDNLYDVTTNLYKIHTVDESPDFAIGPITAEQSFKYTATDAIWRFTQNRTSTLAGGLVITAGLGAANASITNASITNASIQKLKVLNASINNASINTLKTQTFNPTTMGIVNASITNATVQHLTVHASRLKVDQTWDGYSLSATMAATVAFGEVLYTDSSFDYGLANCATSGTLPVSAMAVSAGPAKQKIILRGQICATVWSWSPGLIYCAATDGALTQLIPAGSGKIVQIMGHAISADTMFFNPNKGTVKIA